jgi:uncharacterized protein
MEFTIQDGEKLVKFARENIIFYLKTQERKEIPDDLKKSFGIKMGAFVTLSKRRNKEKDLQGCIGITQPIYPLIDVVSDISLSAAFEDYRFPPVNNMSDIIVEISILTAPQLIEVKKPEDYMNKIKIGRDGLVIERGFAKGLLLPQVPIENNRNWDVKTFLEHLCMKAGMPTEEWKSPYTKIYSFQAIIFEEETPNGKVIRKEN